MPVRFLWALLIVSLALNVFFVGGVIYSKLTEEQVELEPEAVIASVASDLGLNEDQRQGLVDLRDRIRAQWQDARSNSDELREAMLAELAKPELDEAAMQQLASQRYEPRRTAIVETAKEMHAFLATLSDSQRIQFIDMAKEPGFFRKLFGRPKRRS